MAARRERGLFDPDAAAGAEPVRPPHLRDLLRRRHRGGRQPRGQRARRAPEAGQPHRDLRRQPDLHRGRHPDRQVRGRRRPATRRTAGTCRPSTGAGRRRRGRLPRGRRGAVRRRSQAAKAETGRPSFIALRTIIGWPAPNKQNTGKIHGSALGADEVAATKEILGFDPAQTFEVDDEVLDARPRRSSSAAGAPHAEWQRARSTPGRAANPERTALLRPARRPDPARRLDRRAARVPGRRRRAWPPGPRPARCSTRSRRCCRSCGAARPTWPRATTPR